MNIADAQIDIRDVFGRTVPQASIEIVEKAKDVGRRHYRAEVTAPGYSPEGTLLDFRGRGAVVMLLEAEELEIVAMLPCPRTGAKARRATQDREAIAELLMEAVGKHLGIYEHGLHVAKRAPDRVWWHCSASIVDFLQHSGAWRKDLNAGRGHEYEEGWMRIGSWRSNTHVVSMQATVYRRPSPRRQITGVSDDGIKLADENYEYVVELDLDMSGFRHLGQVLWNWLADDETDPRIMAQMCVYFWGMRLPFEMRPQEQAPPSEES